MPVNQHAKQRKKCTETPTNVVTQRPRRVAIIALPAVRMLDVFGPDEGFTDANRLRDGEPAYEVEIISGAEDQIVASHVGTPLLAHRTYRELRSPVDTLLVAGGDDPIIARRGIRRTF
jgi:transcriptional regulator GlxA family with amidase domain